MSPPLPPPTPPTPAQKVQLWGGAYNCLERLKSKKKKSSQQRPRWGSPPTGPGCPGEEAQPQLVSGRAGVQEGALALLPSQGAVQGSGCLQTPGLEGETGGTGSQAPGETGARPKLQPDLKPFKYLGIWYIPFKYLNIFPEYFMRPFKYLAVWAPFAVSAPGPATLRAGLWGIIIIIFFFYYYSCFTYGTEKVLVRCSRTRRREKGRGQTTTPTFCLRSPGSQSLREQTARR